MHIIEKGSSLQAVSFTLGNMDEIARSHNVDSIKIIKLRSHGTFAVTVAGKDSFELSVDITDNPISHVAIMKDYNLVEVIDYKTYQEQYREIQFKNGY